MHGRRRRRRRLGCRRRRGCRTMIRTAKSMHNCIGLAAVAVAAVSQASFAQPTSQPTTAPTTFPTTQAAAPATPTRHLGKVVVTSELDRARQDIAPSLGAVTYTLEPEQIQNIPGGENAPFQ